MQMGGTIAPPPPPWLRYWLYSIPVAYAGFSKGRGDRKFEINEDQNENFPPQNQVRFSAQN